ncbi:unnamed protein product [Tilletia controversa]|uniref:Uncharacterized protein n=3 Tax=Tilletia TaxID=13289 RepID=A0A8X7MZH8_9BASI|nr:hypothetical protein CF328_g8447 [Tilletia controversa]KAE8187260.1 hypothetical protein CF336_g6639 [Tilletia laevis]KAE8253142.1 hypothetical protein A4X03_0g5975 [Tilletia caries]KAE8190777.1 hypothetical protein CF335_g6268 [Tilletia laevis]KAE8253414.1 hypothetical protein A4X06_0g1482 [Tilletia controversa]
MRTRIPSHLPSIGHALALALLMLALILPGIPAANVQRIPQESASLIPASSDADPHQPNLLQALTKRDSAFLCKCTCFGTNTTLVPLFAPAEPSKPCATCTKQFCLDTLGSTPGCKGAKIMASDGDTGTGWEGDIWAKCFQRDGGKDRTIVSLYVLTVLGLLAVAALRKPLGKAFEEYRLHGASAMLRSITSRAPWYQQAQRGRR